MRKLANITIHFYTCLYFLLPHVNLNRSILFSRKGNTNTCGNKRLKLPKGPVNLRQLEEHQFQLTFPNVVNGHSLHMPTLHLKASILASIYIYASLKSTLLNSASLWNVLSECIRGHTKQGADPSCQPQPKGSYKKGSSAQCPIRVGGCGPENSRFEGCMKGHASLKSTLLNSASLWNVSSECIRGHTKQGADPSCQPQPKGSYKKGSSAQCPIQTFQRPSPKVRAAQDGPRGQVTAEGRTEL